MRTQPTIVSTHGNLWPAPHTWALKCYSRSRWHMLPHGSSAVRASGRCLFKGKYILHAEETNNHGACLFLFLPVVQAGGTWNLVSFLHLGHGEPTSTVKSKYSLHYSYTDLEKIPSWAAAPLQSISNKNSKPQPRIVSLHITYNIQITHIHNQHNATTLLVNSTTTVLTHNALLGSSQPLHPPVMVCYGAAELYHSSVYTSRASLRSFCLPRSFSLSFLSLPSPLFLILSSFQFLIASAAFPTLSYFF